MTEIIIEKKKPNWPWMLALGLGLLALILYFFVFKSDRKETGEKPAESLIDVHENISTVADYVTFINSNANKMTLDHSFSNERLLKLTKATYAMAEAVGYTIGEDLNLATELANRITEDPNEATHADNIKIASEMIAHTLQKMQQAKFPGLENEAAEVIMAVEGINPKTLTLGQKEIVKHFFAKSASLLEKMN